jgi:hypothetical protein
MKARTKVLCKTLLVLTLLVAAPLTYSTVRGYTEWWFMSGGHVAVDGVRDGYQHTNWSRSAVIITRTDSEIRQSYLVQLSGSKSLIYCGDWHAPRFPVFPIGDVNPPCMGLDNEGEYQKGDYPLSSTLLSRPGSVEFSTVRGKKVTASW